ncbi:MAG: hypothetical protein MI746_16615 [Pseudomonadales bacterium]|nr:hypothetical protein [Pseudomonadales bacterium]
MKKALLGIATLSMLLLGVGTAQADDHGFRDQSRSGTGWRLGERNRDGYAIYRRQGGNWYRVPGSGIAVADGWVLGSKRESGGYAIYRWNGYDWDQAPGGAVEIGGTYNRPWVINNRGQRFDWNGYDWYRSGFVGNSRGFQSNNRPHREFRDRRDRDRFFGNRHRDRNFRDRFRYRYDRSWDPYRFDERRRYGKRPWRW